MTVAEMKERISELEAEKEKIQQELDSLESSHFNNNFFAYSAEDTYSEEFRCKLRVKTLRGNSKKVSWHTLNYFDGLDMLNVNQEALIYIEDLIANAEDMKHKIEKRIEKMEEDRELSDYDFSNTK